jgi:hypothetical protein
MPVYWPDREARNNSEVVRLPTSGICGWDEIGLGCNVKQVDGLEG